MARRRDREAAIEGARPRSPQGHDEVLAELIASTGRCVASAIKWGAHDVGTLRVLFTSDESCLALHECVARYARLLCEAGESVERTTEIVMAAIDLGSAAVHVQDCIRSTARDWALEAWNGGGRGSHPLSNVADPLAAVSVDPGHVLPER